MIGPEMIIVTTVITISPSKTGPLIIFTCKASRPNTISWDPLAFIPNATAIDSFLLMPLKALPIPAPSNLEPVPQKQNGQHKYYTSEIITDDAIKFMDLHKKDKKPFFVMVNHSNPHSPLDAPHSTVYEN